MSKKKQSTPQDEKFDKQDFDLFQALDALDRKDYAWYSGLSEEQQKKFVPYMLLHWMSAVKSDGLMSRYYLVSTDSKANTNFFNEYVQKHPELQWLMLCSISPGMGKQYHQWIPHLSQNISNLKTQAKLKEVQDYFEKVYKGLPVSDIKDSAISYTEGQQHKYRLAKMFPSMKIDDIENLAKIVSKDELDEYDRNSGN